MQNRNIPFVADNKSFGYSLIELLISISIIGILSFITSSILYQTSYITNSQYNFFYKNQSANHAIDKIAKTVRDANFNNLSNFKIEDHVIIVSNSAGSIFKYWLSGLVLMQNADPLAHDIKMLTFTYFDINGHKTNDLNKVFYVRISLVINSEYQIRLEKTVFLRGKYKSSQMAN